MPNAATDFAAYFERSHHIGEGSTEMDMNVKDRTVSATCMTAYAMWSLAGSLLLVMWGTHDLRWGVMALAAVGIGATATVRAYFVDFTRMVRRAFEMEQESVTPMRR